MRFWDASALVPLFLDEQETPQMEILVRQDSDVVVWWGTRTECLSALARAARENLPAIERQRARVALDALAAGWSEVAPSTRIPAYAERLLFTHVLHAADALQLAAALDWCGGRPVGREFVCRDRRLRDAAASEGFTLLP